MTNQTLERATKLSRRIDRLSDVASYIKEPIIGPFIGEEELGEGYREETISLVEKELAKAEKEYAAL